MSSESGGLDDFAIDPFTQAYRQLRTWILATDEVVAAGVKAANFPDMTSTTYRRPIKSNTQDADHPELLIVPAGDTMAIGRTNIGHSITRQYNIRLAAGEQILHNKFFPVQFAIYVAMCRLHRLNPQLGLDFVESLKAVAQDSGFADSDAQRGTRGWVSLMTVEVVFRFTDSTLDIHKAT